MLYCLNTLQPSAADDQGSIGRFRYVHIRAWRLVGTIMWKKHRKPPEILTSRRKGVFDDNSNQHSPTSYTQTQLIPADPHWESDQTQKKAEKDFIADQHEVEPTHTCTYKSSPKCYRQKKTGMHDGDTMLFHTKREGGLMQGPWWTWMDLESPGKSSNHVPEEKRP